MLLPVECSVEVWFASDASLGHPGARWQWRPPGRVLQLVLFERLCLTCPAVGWHEGSIGLRHLSLVHLVNELCSEEFNEPV
jgi:hypothetical protein